MTRHKTQEKDAHYLEQQNIINKKYDSVPNVDPLSHSLTRCFYTLRLVKTRDYKVKLIAALNYFRAI